MFRAFVVSKRERENVAISANKVSCRVGLLKLNSFVLQFELRHRANGPALKWVCQFERISVKKE